MQKPLEKDVMVSGQLVHYYYAPISSPKKKGTLVFLHGWGSNSTLWFNSTLGLPDQGYELYFFDLPGFGKSQGPEHAFFLDDYAKVVTQLIKKLNITNPTLIGHSFGGKIAIRISAKKMISLTGLILVDASGLPHTSFITKAKSSLAHVMKPIFALPVLKGMKNMLLRLSGSDDYVATPRLRETFIHIVQEHIQDDLPNITIPTLIIWGEDDSNEYTPPSDAHVFRKNIPSSELFLIKKARHYCFLDNSNEFFKCVLSFAIKVNGEN